MRIRQAGAVLATAVATLLIAAGPVRAAAPSEQDSAFLKAAHQSNLAEIATGKQAQQKASSQQVKELGARFVTDHTRLDEALREVARSLDVELPDAPNAEQRAAAARLDAASTDEYDALWLSIQMDQHMKAMANGKKEIDDGSDPAAKKVAQDAAPVIMSHHDLIETAGRELGIPDLVDTGSGGLFGTSSTRTPAIVLLGIGVLLLLVGGVSVVRSRARR
jgi:putative membrane protein